MLKALVNDGVQDRDERKDLVDVKLEVKSLAQNHKTDGPADGYSETEEEISHRIGLYHMRGLRQTE
jgi:hypothetical protein